MNRARQIKLLALLERAQAPAVRREFRRAVDSLRSGVDFSAVEAAIRRGDVAAAISAMNISTAAIQQLEAQMIETFRRSGIKYTDLLPKDLRGPDGARIVFRFDMDHPDAQRWVRSHAANFVASIVSEQRETIRWAILDGLQRGVNPRQSALDIVGRIDPVTKRRRGGIIGLDQSRAEYVRSARRQLSSGDPKQLRAYLRRKLRDRRYDNVVKRALREGRGLSASDARSLGDRYSDRVLKQRGEVVSRTETLNALRAGQHEAFRQGAQSTQSDMERIWDATGDPRTRETHTDADGQSVKGAEEAFAVGGARLRFPGDTELGAPAEEVIQCRCIAIYRIDFASGIAK